MNELLDKYFAGSISDPEKRTLFSAMDKDPELKNEFSRLKNTMALSSLYVNAEDELWAQRKMGEIKLTLDKQRRRKLGLRLAKYVAAATVLLCTWFIARQLVHNSYDTMYMLVEAPQGQRVHVVLNDGTEAWLSSRSRLKIPHSFETKDRTVELDGEAFFSVRKNMDKPFVVKTDKYNVEVLGTQFNVFAYSENNRFETELLEGKVAVYNLNERILLNPNEKVELKDNRLSKSVSSIQGFHFFKNGIFTFEDQKFSTVFNRLSAWYNIRFEVKDSVLSDYSFSGKFRQTDDIENILKALQAVRSFNYTIVNEGEIEIY